MNDLGLRLLDAETIGVENLKTISGQVQLLRGALVHGMAESALNGLDVLDCFIYEAKRNAENRAKEAMLGFKASKENGAEVRGLTVFTLSETIDTLRDIADILKNGGMPLELLIENLEDIATVNEIHRERLEREATFKEIYSNEGN